jgi:predicted dehydrogenase
MTTNDSPAPLRVIQVGLGGFGRSWADVAMRVDGVQLVAGVDPFPAAQEWAREHFSSRVPLFSAIETALAQVECDAVLVITPPVTHHAVVTTALQAGKHVLVEKPLAMTIAEAEDLIALADRAGKTLMVSQNYRFRRPIRAAQAFIASGKLGSLIAVHADFRRHTGTMFGEGNFRYSMMHPLVHDMSIHHFDMLRALTGLNVETVDARSWKSPETWYENDPTVTALMDLDGGVPFTYQGDWAARPSLPDTSWNADWTFKGTTGWLTISGDPDDAQRGTVTFEPYDGERREIEQPELALADRDGSLAAFAEAIRAGTEPETVAADNVKSLAIVLACVASIERGGPVSMAELSQRVVAR